MKKIVDDTERRLGLLFDALNNDALPKDVLARLRTISSGKRHTNLKFLAHYSSCNSCARQGRECRIGGARRAVDDHLGRHDRLGSEFGPEHSDRSKANGIQPGVRQLIRLGL